jgi:hypothetical protein
MIDSGDGGTYAMDRAVETQSGICRTLCFYARMPDEGQKIYAQIRLTNRTGQTSDHWIEFVHGIGPVRPDERTTNEHRIYMRGAASEFGFSRFEIRLDSEVKKIEELRGFRYAQLMTVRLRTGHEEGLGALSISPIRLY